MTLITPIYIMFPFYHTHVTNYVVTDTVMVNMVDNEEDVTKPYLTITVAISVSILLSLALIVAILACIWYVIIEPKGMGRCSLLRIIVAVWHHLVSNI